MAIPIIRSLLLVFLISYACFGDEKNGDGGANLDFDPEALYEEALSLLSGKIGVAKDRNAAIELLKQAAAADFAEAYNLLGFLYIEGNGFFRSPRKGNRMFEKAAALNNASAQFNLGYSYRFGRGAAKDLDKAQEFFKRVVDPLEPHRINPAAFDLYRHAKGSAYYYLGGLYVSEDLLGKDYSKAIDYMTQAESLGNAGAATFLAVQYAIGKEVEKDSTKAEFYLDRYNLLSQNNVRLSINKTYFEGMDRDMDEFLKEMASSIADDLDEEVQRMKISFGVSLMSGEDEDIYDPKMAVRWLTLAEEDSADVRVRLAQLYYRGEGVEKDRKRARDLLERSLRKSVMASYNLGVMKINGEGGAADVEAGRELIEDAADRDLYVARLYLDEQGTLDYLSHEEAKSKCVEAVETQDIRALYSMGMRYLYGRGVDWDKQKARSLIEEAAKRSYAPAQYVLATQFVGVFDGIFTKKWITSSVEQGYLPAKHRMADWLSRGQYFKRDRGRAISMLEECVEEGYPKSMALLGKFYRDGEGVDKDLDRSLNLLERGAALEDPIATMYLAEAYLEGLAVEKNVERGFDLMVEASERGAINANFEVGELYAKRRSRRNELGGCCRLVSESGTFLSC